MHVNVTSVYSDVLTESKILLTQTITSIFSLNTIFIKSEKDSICTIFHPSFFQFIAHINADQPFLFGVRLWPKQYRRSPLYTISSYTVTGLHNFQETKVKSQFFLKVQWIFSCGNEGAMNWRCHKNTAGQ